MKKRKNPYIIFVLLFCIFTLSITVQHTVSADEFGTVPPVEELYTIYSIHTNEALFESEYVEVGDQYVSKNNAWYEVISVDYDNYLAYAEFKAQFYLPTITSETPEHTSTQQVVGLYHTHNAESYVPTDGTDSIYGIGGIHDVGNALTLALLQQNTIVYHNETLHLPHNSSAYTRSRLTAQSLLNTSPVPVAIFDIHRDALPKSSYEVVLNDQSLSKIRIVVGKSNQSYSYNLEFALKIKATSDNLYSGLIKDIYIGKNSYNQDLTNQALIFECGTYLIEKEAVIASMPLLANVINETLFNVSGSGDIIISDDITDNADIQPATDTGITNTDTDLTIDTDLDATNSNHLKDNIKILVSVLFLVGIISLLMIVQKRRSR
ncbi:MAG: stage II sporulation protein P [Clostridia bacterium]|jgi:stage II sporulation protein P